MPSRVLIVDDEKNMREFLKDLLEFEGFTVDAAVDGEDAIAAVVYNPPDLMVLDLRLPRMQGLEVLRHLREKGEKFPVIVITAHGDINTAVDALKAGAADFIVKPFDTARMLAAVRSGLEAGGLLAEAGLSRPGSPGRMPEMVGHSRGMAGVFDFVEKVAATDATVLIRGESGTGKELVARAIHMRSNRQAGPMIALNCAALPDTLFESELFGYERGAFTGAHSKKAGKIELAEQGTLFLDEVGDLSPSAQAKLLRVLEAREFSPLGSAKVLPADIRVIAATNRDLEAMLVSGAFREDLFFRLNVVPVYLPPLRERRDDIPALAEHFLAKCNRRHKRECALSALEVARLETHSWPGNIRELEHVIEKFVLLGELPLPEAPLTARLEKSVVDAFPGAPAGDGQETRPLREAMKEAERAIIIRALQAAGGSRKAAAQALDISYKTLFNKINDLDIKFRSEIE